jgi:hypothetical protein
MIDTQQERFAKLLDQRATQFTLQTFDDDYTRKDRSLVRVIASGNVNDPTLAQLNEMGAGIFVTINQTDLKWRSNDNITRIRAVWQEDDDGFAGTFPMEPTAVVESSPGKYHRYWLVSDEWPADERGRGDFEGSWLAWSSNMGATPPRSISPGCCACRAIRTRNANARTIRRAHTRSVSSRFTRSCGATRAQKS